MKAVQTLWMDAGTGHRQPSLLWRLSNHFLRENFDRVELYADAEGRTYAEGAGLVYDEIFELPPPHEGFASLWSLGKLITASRQTEPFIHVDGDVFLRTVPPAVPFIVQNAEPNWHSGTEIGAFWAKQIQPVADAPLLSYCFGIFGGTAHQEIAAACQDTIDFLYANAEAMREPMAEEPLLCTILVEQIWVPMFLQKRGVEITSYLDPAHMWEDAVQKRYFHAMGGKRNSAIMQRVEALAARTL